MFVKVTLGEDKFVVPFKPVKNMTISKLIEVIKAKYIKEFGKFNIDIPQLYTSDSFFYGNDDLVEEMIKDGDHVIAMSSDTFKLKNTKFCNTKWLSVERKDLKTGYSRTINVGFHENNKIFIQMIPNESSARLTKLICIDPDRFDGKSTTSTPLIATCEDMETGSWFMEVKFWLNDKKVIRGLEAHVKTTNDKSVWVDAIMIGLNKIGQLVKGSIQHLKGSDDEDEDEDEDEEPRDLPDPERSGPEFMLAGESLVNPSVRFGQTKSSAVGYMTSEAMSCELELLPISNGPFDVQWNHQGTLYTNQDYWKCDGGEFQNYFEFHGVVITNKRSEKSSVAKITSYWKDEIKNWIQSDFTSLGVVELGSDPTWKNDTILHLDDLQSSNISLSCQIKRSGKIAYSTRRIHKIFPKPLHVKFEFVDFHGNSSSIVLELMNPPLHVINKEIFLKENKCDTCVFVYCDNLDHDQRLWAGVFKKKNRIYLHLCNGDNIIKKFEISVDDLNSSTFNAVEAKEGEFELKNWSLLNSEYGNTLKVYLCVDLRVGKPYAFKFQFKTPTSSAIEYVHLTRLPKPRKSLTPLTVMIHPINPRVGEDFDVFFNVQGHHVSKTDSLCLYREDETNPHSYILFEYNANAVKNDVLVLSLPPDYKENTPGKYVVKYIDQGYKVICTSDPFFIDDPLTKKD